MTTGADWVDQAKRLVDTFLTAAVSPPPDGEVAGAAHADTCRWCPLCQVAAVARGERPEVSAALADVLTATAGALRAFADQGRTSEGPAAPPETPADDEADAGPAVQRIDIA
jgi:hypothetical protein